MSETSTIASSKSSESRRLAIDLSSVTHPLGQYGTIRLTGAASADESSSIKPAAAESFIMNDKFIYSTATTPATAAFHLSTRNTRTGKPWQLQISHLLPSETRRLSVAASSPADETPYIKYDEDLTLYTGERIAVPISIGQKPLLCIRGRRRGTLAGTVVLERALLGRSRAYKFWHMTPVRRPQTQAENERMQALMHRRGYKMSDDWNKELLYTVQGKGGSGRGKEMVEGTEWTDESGGVVAIERDGQLVVLAGHAGTAEADRRDLLVACWASKNFVQSTRADDEE